MALSWPWPTRTWFCPALHGVAGLGGLSGQGLGFKDLSGCVRAQMQKKGLRFRWSV